MREVLLIGGKRDGQRFTVADGADSICLIDPTACYTSFDSPDTPVRAAATHTRYVLERFQCQRYTAWVAYPEGTDPVAGLKQLLAGYRG